MRCSSLWRFRGERVGTSGSWHTFPVALAVMVVTGCQDAALPTASPDVSALPGPRASSALASFTPNQALVFDGSSQAEATFGVAFNDGIGFLLDLGDLSFTCPEAAHSSEGGTFQVAQERAVLQSLISVSEPVPVPSDPSQVPPALTSVDNACELLGQFAALQQYLDEVDNAADQLVAQVETCLNTAQALYCHAVAAIEEAEVIPQNAYSTILPGLGPSTDDMVPADAKVGPVPCTRPVDALHQIPGFLDALEGRRLGCLQRHEILSKIPELVADAAAFFGGLSLADKERLLAAADGALAEAEESLDLALHARAEIDELVARLTKDKIEEACEECPPDSPGFTELTASGAVLVSFGKQPLGRYEGSFRSAADAVEETDPDLAVRLDDLARRLAGMDGDRVMQVTYPSSSAVGQEHLAVAPPGAPDDGVTPLVVVLTALERDAPLPDPNPADLQLLFDAFRQFRATLGPRFIDR